MTNTLYDFIIGNVNGARNVTNPDPHWRTKQVCDVNKSFIPNIVQRSAVVTRVHATNEQENFKALKVIEISGKSIWWSVIGPGKWRYLDQISRFAESGKCKYTGKQHVSWFIMERFLILFLYFQGPWVYDNILFKQFVVHIQHRKTIMTLTHKSVFAGYLGMHRVTERVF